MRLTFYIGILGFSFLLAQEERVGGVTPKLGEAPKLRLSGRVLDAKTGEPLAGVELRVRNRGTFSDERGIFALTVEEPDTLSAFLLGYRPLKVPFQKSLDGLLLRLESIEAEIEAVPIIAEADKETEAGLFLERLRQLEIGELYSQELIMKRSTDFYVPNVLRRLPGVSLLSGRYVSIRGMGERYNAFAFWAAYPAWLSYDASFGELDQLITTLLGRVEVRKFWTPELLGHFGGGLVDFQLPSASGNEFQVALTTEIDAQTIGQRFPVFRMPLRDPLPAGFPSIQAVYASENNGRPLPENFIYARQLQRYTAPDTLGWAPPGPLLTLAFNRRTTRWRVALRAAFSQRYLYSKVHMRIGDFVEQDGNWTYNTYLETPPDLPDRLYHFHRGGGLAWNIGYQLSSTQAFALEGIALSNTAQRLTIEQSNYINPEISPTEKINIYYPTFHTQWASMVLVRPSWIYQGRRGWHARLQLGGIFQNHLIPQNGAMNYARYPGKDFYSYEHELYGPSEIYAQIWTSRTTAYQGYIHPFVEKRWDIGESWLQVRGGGWLSYEDHRFRGRQLGYMTDTLGGGPDVLDPAVYHVDNIRNVYAPEHIRPGGWYLMERTTDFHRHTGLTYIAAGYGWVRFAQGLRWEALLGARYEYWQRRLTYQPIASNTDTLLREFREGHLLPAALFKYALTERHVLRAGGSFTLLRPPIPTQVPLRYFDYFWVIYWSGDPRVGNGWCYNADLRYEWLKDKDNLIAFGLFYKHLRQLPEIYLEPSSYGLVLLYSTRQRSWGDIAGIEVEFRRVWWENERNRLWSYLTFTLSESGVERSVWRKLGRLEGRLQGHSPLVGNMGILYNHRGLETALFLNYTAAQIWAMGFDPYVYPHLVEEGRLIGEFQISYQLGRRWEIRLAVWDFINQPYQRTQRLGNANTFRSDRDARPHWERWAYRGYLTLRYRLTG